MRNLKTWARLLALTLCAALLMTCAVVAEEPTEAPQATEVPDVAVAIVGDVEVMKSQVDTIAYNLQSYFGQSYDITDESIAASINQMALDMAIQYEVMEQKARELGVHDPSEEELAELTASVDQEWTDLVEYAAATYFGKTDDSTDEEKSSADLNALALLESMGYTKAMMEEQAKENFWYDKLTAMLVEGATVADGDVENYFNELVKEDEAQYKDNVLMYEYMTQYYGQPSYYVPEGYRGIVHILLNVDEELMNNYSELAAQLEEQISAMEAGDAEAESDADTAPVTQEQVDAAYDAILASVQPTVDEIMTQFRDGTPFAELIEKYGNDPGMTVEPTKSEGYSVHQDSVVWDPAFVKAAFSVENVGDVSDPVVGSYGVHIVQYLRDVPAGPVDLTDEIRSELYETLMADAENKLFDEKVSAWVEEANVQYTAEAAAYQLPEDDSAEE